jgi:hypothetical protein
MSFIFKDYSQLLYYEWFVEAVEALLRSVEQLK